MEIDGRTVQDVSGSAGIEVRAAPRKARLVRTRPRTFYRDLAGRSGLRGRPRGDEEAFV
jgi:hypothetical protein